MRESISCCYYRFYLTSLLATSTGRTETAIWFDQ